MNSDFNLIGTHIPKHRYINAYDFCTDIGIDNITANILIPLIARELEHDKPDIAMKIGLGYMDLTGVYRLMSCLLTG